MYRVFLLILINDFYSSSVHFGYYIFPLWKHYMLITETLDKTHKQI